MKETDIFLKAVKDETEKFIDSADISLSPIGWMGSGSHKVWVKRKE